MQLRDYLSTIRRHRWLVAFAILATAGAAFGFSSRKPPVYQARARIFIGPRAVLSGDIGSALEELTFSREFIASYAELLKSRPLADRVVELDSLPYPAADLAARVTTKVLADTRIIEVTVADGEARRARRIANTLVQTFVGEGMEELGGAAGVHASVLEPALLPGRPVSPKPPRDAVLGGLLGLAIGTGTAFVLDHLDDTLRSRAQVEAALGPLPVLAALPRTRRSRKRRLVFDRDPRSPAAEAFRSLRTGIRLSALDAPVPRVLVTSPSPGDGKTYVAANLAASLALSGVRTILVGTDLRRPVIHHYLNVGRSPGVTDVVGGAEIEQALHECPLANLMLLPAGRACPNPSELLGSQQMADLLDDISRRAELVVLDAPPALAVTDAAVLGAHADGVILVLRAGRTQLRWAQETRVIFERAGLPILGVVVNDVDQTDLYYYYRSYHRTYAKNGSKRAHRRKERIVFDELRPADRRRPQQAARSQGNGNATQASDGDGLLAPSRSAPDAPTLPAAARSEWTTPRRIDLRGQETPPSPTDSPADRESVTDPMPPVAPISANTATRAGQASETTGSSGPGRRRARGPRIRRPRE